MEDAKYMFLISPYDTVGLLPQVSKALEKRMEIVSRKQYPGIWRLTDKFNSMARGRTRNRLRTKLMSLICLAIGVFLLVPGVMDPQELLAPLLIGALAVGAGMCGLWRSRTDKKNAFDKAAKQLLAGKDGIATGQVTVSFSEEGMTIQRHNGTADLIPFSDFECALEGADMLLFVYDRRVMVLQKVDLTTGNISDFCKLISKKVTQYQSVI